MAPLIKWEPSGTKASERSGLLIKAAMKSRGAREKSAGRASRRVLAQRLPAVPHRVAKRDKRGISLSAISRAAPD